jgi:hypothetical protein
MWVNVHLKLNPNVHLKLDPRDKHSRELIELLKYVTQTELNRQSRPSYHPLEWLRRWISNRLDKWAEKTRAGAKIPQGRGMVKA